MNFNLNLRKKCLEQNRLLVKKKLVIHNFGNVSLRIDKNHFTIKPSGINLKTVKSSDFPIINLKTNRVIKGKLKPSSDTPTHLEIYKKYSKIKSITHAFTIRYNMGPSWKSNTFNWNNPCRLLER